MNSKEDFIQKKIDELIAATQANLFKQEGREMNAYEMEKVKSFWSAKLNPAKMSKSEN